MVGITLANNLTYLSANQEVETDKRPINDHSPFRESNASQLVTKPLNFNSKSEVTQQVEKSYANYFYKGTYFRLTSRISLILDLVPIMAGSYFNLP